MNIRQEINVFHTKAKKTPKNPPFLVSGLITYVHGGYLINKRIMADHQMSIHTNFASTWPSGLREENWNLIVYGKSW